MNFKKIVRTIEVDGNKNDCLKIAKTIVLREGVCDGLKCQECPASDSFNEDEGCDTNGWVCREEEHFDKTTEPNKGLLKNCKDFIAFVEGKQMEFSF